LVMSSTFTIVDVAASLTTTFMPPVSALHVT
jgi:hypothetical protein